MQRRSARAASWQTVRPGLQDNHGASEATGRGAPANGADLFAQEQARAPRMMKKGEVMTSAMACQIGTLARPATQVCAPVPPARREQRGARILGAHRRKARLPQKGAAKRRARRRIARRRPGGGKTRVIVSHWVTMLKTTKAMPASTIQLAPASARDADAEIGGSLIHVIHRTKGPT